MIPVIYHTGLTPPPPIHIAGYEVCYFSVLKVEYESSNAPQDISDILLMNPIVLMMSKNAVIGLHKWLLHFGLKSDFFADADFWTVGERTHECLKKILGIESFYPDEMTGKGVILALQKQNYSNILLISGQKPRQEFIEGLSSAGINFFHFPVYKIYISEGNKLSVHFKNHESNYLIITSPSAVDGILRSLSLLDLSRLKSRIISIGPTTSAAIRQSGGDVFLESEVQNINALYDSLEKLIAESSHAY